MAKVTEQVEMSKEARELGAEVAKLIKDIKALKDAGKNVMEIAAAVGSSHVMGIVNAVNGLDQLGAEEKEDPQAFAMAWGVSGAEVFGVFVPKSAPAPVPPVA